MTSAPDIPGYQVTAAGRLSGHPYVIEVYDAGTLRDGRPFLAMELCPAGSLDSLVRAHGQMTGAQVRDIGIRIADALAAAHGAGVLHRDIKPGNILVNRYGMVGLADFGLASILAPEGELTVTRETLTPAYASPESLRLAEPTVAGDIYSLAATLYALLAGRPPRFPADSQPRSLAEILALHAQPIEDVPGAQPELMTVLHWGLAADPADRPPTAAALRDALAAVPAGSGQAGAQAAAGPVFAAASALPSAPASAAVLAQADREVSAQLGPPAQVQPGQPAPGQAGLSAPLPWPAPGGPAQPPGARSPGTAGTASRPPGNVPARSRRSRSRWRRPLTVAAAVAAAAVVFAAGRLLPVGGRAPGGHAGSGQRARDTGRTVPAVFGVATTSADCPAAEVGGAGARCPAAPECWAGIVIVSGDATTQSVPCRSPHSWQTFAIGILPGDARTFDQTLVAQDKTVRAVCSMAVLLRSRRGAGLRRPARGWQIMALPPDEAAFYAGARAYRCVASSTSGTELRGSQFGPAA
ncbi:MAG: serine/threonine-protein kinase [Streptosporangiaceae bacterium]